MTVAQEPRGRPSEWHLLPPLIAYIVLATLNATIVPWFELPDEKHHLHYAQYLAREHRLPDLRLVTSSDSDTSVCSGFNPPLYHILAACALPPDAPYLSPKLAWHPKGARGFSEPPQGGWGPHQGILERLALLRCLSILFGSLTMIGCFVAGRILSREGRSLAIAMAWFPVALPQFVSMSAAINNEGAATALMAIGVAFAAQAASVGSRRAAAAAGLLLGLSLLAKVSGLALVPAFALVLWQVQAHAERRWSILLLGLGVAGLVASPWFLRNFLVTGGPLASHAMVAAAVQSGVGAFPRTPGGVLRGLGLLFASFYACYGQLAVWLPRALYLIPLAVASAAAAGWAVRRPAPGTPQAAFARAACVALACVLGAWLAYNLRVYSPQGRYLFIAMPFLAFLSLRGLQAWFPWVTSPGWAHTACAACASLQVAYLMIWVRHAYGA